MRPFVVLHLLIHIAEAFPLLMQKSGKKKDAYHNDLLTEDIEFIPMKVVTY